MLIGVCQTPDIVGDVDAAVDAVCELAANAAAADTDLLLFPECFLQGYLVDEDHVRRQAFEVGSAAFADVLARLARITQTLVLGMLERAGDSFYNTALVVAAGRVLGGYRKTFLTAGESVFTCGERYPIFECAGVRYGINICYDAQFPEAAAGVADGGADLLLLPAQNMMPRDKAFWWQDRHNLIRTQRVRETGMWLASADVTGERADGRIGLGLLAAVDLEDDGVVGGGDGSGWESPAGWVPAGLWWSWCRGGAQSVVVSSAMAVRVLDSSTMALPSAKAARSAWTATLLTMRG